MGCTVGTLMIILNAPSLYDHREPIPYTCTNSTDFFKLPGYKPEDEEFVRRFICRGHSFIMWIMGPVGFFDVVPALPCPWFLTCKLLFLTGIHIQRRRPEEKKHVSFFNFYPVFVGGFWTLSFSVLKRKLNARATQQAQYRALVSSRK